MKKNILLLGLAAGMLLAACQPKSDVSSSEVASSKEEISSSVVTPSSSSSSSEATIDRKAALISFMRKVADNNLTVEVNGLFEGKTYWLGTQAVLFEEADESGATTRQGYLVNGKQGIFKYSLDAAGTALTLGAFVDPSTDITDALICPAVTFTSSIFADYLLSAGGTELIYTFDLASLLNDQYGVYFVRYMLSVASLGSSVLKFVTSLSLILNAEDPTQATVSVALQDSSGIYSHNAVMTAFGSTENAVVSEYLKNPTEVKAPTDWSATAKKAINDVFKTDADKIVFPTGLVTYAFADSPAYDDNNKVNGVTFSAYNGDIRTAYTALLEKAGYTKNYDYCGANSTGDAVMGYTIEITPATDTAGAKLLLASIVYSPDDNATGAQFQYVQAPVTYDALTIEEANKQAVDAINKAATYDIPKLIASDVVTEVNAKNFTGATNYESYAYAWQLELAIAKEADALAYAKSYIKAISSKYVDSGKYTLEENGVVVYYVAYGQQVAALLQIGLAYNSAGKYDGKVIISALGAI